MERPQLAMAALALALVSPAAFAQAPAPAKPAANPEPPKIVRPALFLREAWKQNPNGAERSLTQSSLGNPDLEMRIYGPDPALQGDKSVLKTTGRDGDENNPSHIFSGECRTACGFTLRSRKAFANLATPLARIRVVSKMSGLHKVYPVIKLASGDWYVGDRPTGPSTSDWMVSEFDVADVATWLKIDPATLLTKGNPAENIDLSKVDEIGFADPMPASGHGAGGWFDVGQIEVFAGSTPR